jgi:hypothetical protein
MACKSPSCPLKAEVAEPTAWDGQHSGHRLAISAVILDGLGRHIFEYPRA